MSKLFKSTSLASLAAVALLATTSVGHAMANDAPMQQAQVQTMASPAVTSNVTTDPQTRVTTSKVTVSSDNLVRDNYVISSELRPSAGDPQNYAQLDQILPQQNQAAISSNPVQTQTTTTMTATTAQPMNPAMIEPAAGNEFAPIQTQAYGQTMTQEQAELAADGQIIPSVRQGELSPEINVHGNGY